MPDPHEPWYERLGVCEHISPCYTQVLLQQHHAAVLATDSHATPSEQWSEVCFWDNLLLMLLQGAVLRFTCSCWWAGHHATSHACLFRAALFIASSDRCWVDHILVLLLLSLLCIWCYSFLQSVGAQVAIMLHPEVLLDSSELHLQGRS